MSFNGNGTKLTGDDGFIKNALFGAEIAGDASTPLPVPGVYLIIAVAGSSAFPAPAEGGDAATTGDFLNLKTGDSVTPAVGDDVVTVTLTNKCDLSAWGMEFSKGEIEVTTYCDAVKKYRSGKSDMAGSMSGINTVGITDDPTNGYLRQFIRLVKQDGDASFDSFAQNDDIPLGFFYTNDDTSIADEMYVIAPFQIFGEGLGGEQGSGQTFSTSFRFANFNYTTVAGADIAINPTYYRLGDGA